MSSFIRTKDHLTVVFENGETVTVYITNPRYGEVVEAVRKKDWDRVRMLSMPVVGVKQKIAGNPSLANRVRVEGGIVFLDDKPMHNALTDRMIEMVTDGFDVQPMARFLENLMDNVSYRAVNELYTFMEHSNLPITEDGHFIAYKRVRGNYKDIYSGKIDNSIGATPEMPRNEVDEDKDRTCSKGLHFCSREYLPSYGTEPGNRTMIVKINPRDVVSIPSDYNNAKGRCCRYEVIGELTHKNEEPIEGAYRPTETPKDHDKVDLSGKTFTPHIDKHGVASNVTPAVQMIEMFNPDSQLVLGTFRTTQEAQERTGVDASSIGKVCRGERKSAGGYGWRYTTPRIVMTNQSNATDLKQNPLRDPYYDPDQGEADEWDDDRDGYGGW